MGFWTWFWIWTFLSLGALTVLAFIGKSLLNRAQSVAYQLEQIVKPVAALIEAVGEKPDLQDLESDLLTPSAILERERTQLLKRKSKKQDARQRSLISALKHIEVQESRFKNVR